MKKILLIFGTFLLGFILNNTYGQSEIERDIIKAGDELYVRDTTINELINVHTSGSSVGAGNGNTKNGNIIGWGGTLDSTTSVLGVGYEIFLGTALSKTGAHNVNTSGAVTFNSDGNQVFNVNGSDYTFDGTQWISSSNDTLATRDFVNTQIAAGEPVLPFNFDYILYASTTDSKPGTGAFRLNNATPANVTRIYIDDYDINTVYKKSFLQLADTGSYFYIQDADDNSNYYIYQCTGGYTSATGYVKYNVTYITASGSVATGGLCTNVLEVSNSTGTGGGGVADSSFVSILVDTVDFNNGGEIYTIGNGNMYISDHNKTIAVGQDASGDSVASNVTINASSNINLSSTDIIYPYNGVFRTTTGDTLATLDDIIEQTGEYDPDSVTGTTTYMRTYRDTTWDYYTDVSLVASEGSLSSDTIKTNYINELTPGNNIEFINSISIIGTNKENGLLYAGTSLPTDKDSTLNYDGEFRSNTLTAIDDASATRWSELNNEQVRIYNGGAEYFRAYPRQSSDGLAYLFNTNTTRTSGGKVLEVQDINTNLFTIYNEDSSKFHNELKLDSGLSIGGSAKVDSIIELKAAVEAESFDEINVGVLKVNRMELDTVYHGIGGFEDSTITVTISASDTWYHVTNATNNAIIGLDASGMSISGDTLTFDNSGDYRGTISVTFSGSNGNEYQFRVYNVTQARQVAFKQGETASGFTSYANISFPVYEEITAGDEFVLQVENISASNDAILRHFQFETVYLHE